MDTDSKKTAVWLINFTYKIVSVDAHPSLCCLKLVPCILHIFLQLCDMLVHFLDGGMDNLPNVKAENHTFNKVTDALNRLQHLAICIKGYSSYTFFFTFYFLFCILVVQISHQNEVFITLWIHVASQRRRSSLPQTNIPLSVPWAAYPPSPPASKIIKINKISQLCIK